MLDKEIKDRIADYHKETLKAKYELLRIFALLDLTIGTGLVGFSLKKELEPTEVLLIIFGTIFFFATLVFIFKTLKEIDFHLNALKELRL